MFRCLVYYRYFCIIMSKEVKKRVKVAPTQPKRVRRMVCWVSEDEASIIDRYLEKNKISNKGRWMRETVLAHVYRRTMDDDYPTLFNEHDMRR